MSKEEILKAIELNIDKLLDLKDEAISLRNRAKENGMNITAAEIESAYDAIRQAIQAYARAGK